MAGTVRSILAGITPGDDYSLRKAALELDAVLVAVPAAPDDPGAAYDVVEERGAELTNTWQEVRAARDHGELAEPDYEFLATAVDSLNPEV